ncbi:hypothetical protein ACIBG8_53900 [Nonomuraea sp. NPDC050556]|uniref:hypothetical protein n=1 Tax=Nonomuraea sp. NPDC050556 TaxID=3364369 RepID=UPI003794A3BD
MREIPCCFECWPGGPVTPPPCRYCGSRRDYYTSGLCARCHTHAPGEKSPAWRLLHPGRGADGRGVVSFLVDSCRDCLGWGVTRTYGWLCAGCKSWREHSSQRGICAGCGLQVALDDERLCRLCRKNRIMLAHREGRRLRAVCFEAHRSGQQLFLAASGMWHQQGHGRRPYRKKTIPVDMSRLRPVTHRQLVLFELPRDLRAGLARGFPPPPDAELERAFHQFVREHARRYGWSKAKADRIQRAIRIMLGIQDTPGAPIRRSDVMLLSRIKHSAAVVADVLTEAGMLQEDREPAIVHWFAVNTAALPEPMRHELRVWLTVMREGSASPPRCHPRADTTIRTQLREALPALTTWASGHASLREIGRDDVLAVLPPRGMPRATMLTGLRSIFRVLKGRKLTFVNPTARISAPTPDKPIPAPVDLAALRAALDSTNPATALLSALLAFHAVRIHQLGKIRLTDIRDGRLHIGDQVILLADPVRQRLSRYLNFRNTTWPTTINPHLFLHVRNRGNQRPATVWWVRHQLTMPGQLIRQDRILAEATATGGDVRALCDLFGLSIAGSCRYSAALDRIDDPRTLPARAPGS